MPPLVASRLAGNRHGPFVKYGGGIKNCTVMLAAIEAMAQPDAVRIPRGFEANIATEAAACMSCHPEPPTKVMGYL